MYMVAVVTVMDRTTVMATTLVDPHIWVDLNHHHMVRQTILIDTSHIVLGVLVVMDLSTVTVVQEVEKVSS